MVDVTAGSDWLAEVREELADGTGLLVIRHVDALNARQVRALTEALAGANGRPGSAATAGRGHPRPARRPPPTSPALLRLFPGTVEVPPLRHHIEDVRELVPFFLAKLSQQGRAQLLARPRCSCCCGTPGRATPSSSGRC